MMARLGHWGFTITLVNRRDGDEHNVLLWAGGGNEAMSESKLYNDLDNLLDMAEEKNQFKHWTEVWT